jgi:hypothetical protein
MPKILYSHNNSGGGWWLMDEDWKNLEAAGWSVEWVKNSERFKSLGRDSGRWLGALATSATREGLSLEEAVAEFERITNQNAKDEGCECCGRPHYFSVVNE